MMTAMMNPMITTIISAAKHRVPLITAHKRFNPSLVVGKHPAQLSGSVKHDIKYDTVDKRCVKISTAATAPYIHCCARSLPCDAPVIVPIVAVTATASHNNSVVVCGEPESGSNICKKQKESSALFSVLIIVNI